MTLPTPDMERVVAALERIAEMKPLPSHPWEMVAIMKAVASEQLEILRQHDDAPAMEGE